MTSAIYVGLDDTDTLESIGTGRLARMMAEALVPFLEEQKARFVGITRHQLLVDPRVPYTKKNSCSAIHIEAENGLNDEALANTACAFMSDHLVPGADPGVCVATQVPPEVRAFGARAQREVVSQSEARALANQHGLILRGLGGTEDGVIGALAGVGLAVSGDNGRYTHVGHNRDLDGLQPVSAILEAGISEVRDLQGNTIAEGWVVTGGRLRPALREGRAILYVEPGPDGWLPLKLD